MFHMMWKIFMGYDGVVTAMNMPNDNARIEPRKQPKQKRSIKRVESILTSAELLLARHGFSHLRMTDIAAEAGVPVGSVYQFFPQKAAVLRAILDQRLGAMMQDIASRLTDIRDENDARMRLMDLIDHVAQLHRDNPVCREMWIALSTDPDLEILQYKAQQDIGTLTLTRLGPFAGGRDGAAKQNRFMLAAILTGSVFRCVALGHERAGAMLDEWKSAVCTMLFQQA